MATVVFSEQLVIPAIDDLSGFRVWVQSDVFPDTGRIDYVDGRIEVDMSPEDLFTHGTLKTEIAGEIRSRVRELDLGHTLIAETRVSSAAGRLSAEPDVVVVTYRSLDDGRVVLIPKSSQEAGRYVEVEGGPDLVIEIVSDSSVEKDTQRLPKAYFAAGVQEYWLIDARGEELFFQIGRRGQEAFEAVPKDGDGFHRSTVLDANYRLDRERHPRGHWDYHLRQA